MQPTCGNPGIPYASPLAYLAVRAIWYESAVLVEHLHAQKHAGRRPPPGLPGDPSTRRAFLCSCSKAHVSSLVLRVFKTSIDVNKAPSLVLSVPFSKNRLVQMK